MNSPKFSVVTVGRNEAKTLPRLLNSLEDFFCRGGEMIFVDTGSTDNTADVARRGGCRVYEEGDRFRYVIDDEKAMAINDKFVVPPDPEIIHGGDSFFSFDKARNYAMGLASNDFICTPDCDEAWTNLDIDRINELIDEGYEKFFVDFVFAHNPDGTPAVEFVADTRLYDKRRISWKGIIHETMQHNGELKTMRLPREVALLEHYQNKETDRSRYLAGLAWACYEEPDNDRNSHYFARELMYKGYYNSSIKEFIRHIDMNGWPEERGQSMVFMGTCQDAIGEHESALAWWHRAFDLTGARRESLINLAYYWKRRDKFPVVAAYAAAALQIPNNGFYGNRVANYTYEPHALMYWAKGWLGDIPAARQHWMRCYDYHPDDQVFMRDFQFYFSTPKVSVCIPTIRPDKLERCIAAIKENAGYDNYEIIAEPDNPENPQGAPKVLKRAVEKSTGELVLYLGDDTLPEKNFLYHAVVAMNRYFPDMDGMIGLNDHIGNGLVASHWLASKKLLPMLGGEFFSIEYEHLWCDDELTSRCVESGKYKWEEKATLFHDHPFTYGDVWPQDKRDKHYDRVFLEEAIIRGRKILERRSKEFGFPIRPYDYTEKKYRTVPFKSGRQINRIALPITRACNRDCPECSARKVDHEWDKLHPHVSVAELKWVGRTLGPIKTIEVTGGEPSIHPDFEEISKNFHKWFQSNDIMLLTNAVEFLRHPEKLPLLLYYDRVYISWYTDEFSKRYGTPDNTEAVRFVEGYLKSNNKPVWVQRMDAHCPIGSPPYKGVATCGYDLGDSVGYGEGKIHGCCTSYWLPYKGESIPLSFDWRKHLKDIQLPCPECFLTGKA